MNRQLRGLCLLLALYPLAGTAQDFSDEELEPGVSSEALEELEAEEAPPEPAAAADGADADVDEDADDIRRTRSGSAVMDEIELGRTEITGNQELPKVLYIVPWQKSGPGELLGRPVNSLLDEVLAPIDRSEFIREVDYYDDLYGNDSE
jgi:hypothetical protein